MSNNKVLDKALSIIDEHIKLSYREIAKKLYGETGYCDQDFNKFLAIASSGALTLSGYIRKRRLFFAACDLANGSDKTIVDISSECGYSDQTAFTRAIKKEYGKTPAEIRKNKEYIPNEREMLERKFSNKSQISAITEKYESDSMSDPDWSYLETFNRAIDELGFDISTCCLLSELSERLSIPYGRLIEKCFEMAVECNQSNAYQTDEIYDCMVELGIEDQEELADLCEHYNCKWYELTFIQVKVYQLGANSAAELRDIWDYYHCNWMLGEPYPLTKQMVQEYHEKQ